MEIPFTIWILLGGMIALINRKPNLGKTWFVFTLILGIIALWAVYFMPGS